MTVEFFKPQYRTVQNPVDLNVLASTYNTLESKHLQAVELESKYKQALQELPLHPNEDAWVAQQGQAIQSAFNDNLNYGNAAAALDDLVRVWGDIKSNPGMKGRLRANQEYQNYMTNLEANKTLDEDTKAYYREKNKYYYQDTYDKNGNIIGGTEWKPLEREVNHIPRNLIYEYALKWAAKEGGMGNSIKFLDANGKPTDKYNESITGEIFTNVSGKWERLSEDKVRAAVNAAMEAIPGAKASFEQEYKVANWKFDNGKFSDITDRNGVRMTKEQYFESKINPFINAVTYHNNYSTITYGDAWKSQLAASPTSKVGSGLLLPNQAVKGLTSTNSDLVRIKNNAPVEAQAEITTNRQLLSNILNSVLNEKIDLHTATDEQREQAISSITDPKLRAQAASYNLKIKDAQDYINNISQGKDDIDVEKFEVYNAVMSNSDLPNNNAAEPVKKRINNFFGDADAIRQYLTPEELNNFKSLLGVENILNNGIIIGNDSKGRPYVQLNKNNYEGAYMFANGVEQSSDISFFSGDSQRLVRVKNGQEINASEVRVGLGNFVNLINSYNQASDRVLDGGEIFKPIISMASPTPAIAELDVLINNGVDVSNNKSRRDAMYKQFVESTIPNIAITQTNGYILDEETRTYRQMTSGEALENTKILRSDIAKDLKYSIVPDPITGDACIQVTVPGELDDDKYSTFKREPRSFIIGSSAINDPNIKSWNNRSEWESMNKLSKYLDAGRPLALTNDLVFNNVPNITFTSYGIDGVTLNINGISVGNIDRETAQNLLKPIIEVQKLAEYTKYDEYPEQVVRPLVTNAANVIAKVINGDEGDANYYESIIMQNLGY